MEFCDTPGPNFKVDSLITILFQGVTAPETEKYGDFTI